MHVLHEPHFLRLTFIRQCRMLIVMIFIEASIFTKLISKYLSDDEYTDLVVKHFSLFQDGLILND